MRKTKSGSVLAMTVLLALSTSGAAGASGGDTTAPPAATSPTATATSVDRSIETLLGDPAAFRDVFDRLQRGIATGDKTGVAALVAYPLDVVIDGKRHRIANAASFVASWDRIMTPEILGVIASQRYEALFVNAQGVMLGDGQVWITGVCRDRSCAKSDVRVTTIQPGPK